MPYAPEHKPGTRARIVESARVLFNRHGFTDVSINAIMAEAVDSFLYGQCPMIALPSDVARESTTVQASYQKLIQAMVGLFEHTIADADEHARRSALAPGVTDNWKEK